MASDKLMNHTQGETIITKLTAIADSLDDLAAVTPAKLGMGIATCDTAASTAAKTAALANFALVEGAPVSVKFTYANTATNATLNINNTGAKPIIYKDAAIGNDVISAGDTCTFIYTTNTYKITNIDTLTGPGSGTVRQVGAENGLITDQTDNADIQTTGNIGLNLKSTTAFSTEVGAHNTSTDNMYPVALDSEGHPVAAVPTMSASGSGHKGGLVPDPGSTAGTKKYLAENGEWTAPDSTWPSTPTDNTMPSTALVDARFDTDEANIAYNLDNGVKNLIVMSSMRQTIYGITINRTPEGITISGTATETFSIMLTDTRYVDVPAWTDSISGRVVGQLPEKVILTGAPDNLQQNRIIVALYQHTNNTWIYSFSSLYEMPQDLSSYTYDEWYAYIPIVSGNTYSGTWKPMLRDATIADDTFVNGAKTNSELTTLVVESQPALVEQIDEGAKNILKQLGTISSSGFTITRNADTSINIKGQNTTSSAINITIGRFVPEYRVTYVASGCPSDGSVAGYSLLYGKTGVTLRDVGSGQTFISEGGEYSCYISIGANYSLPEDGVTFYPMVCTKADWDVSKKFVQCYTKSNKELTTLEAEDRAAIVEQVNEGAKNRLDCSLDALKAINIVGVNSVFAWYGNVCTFKSGDTTTGVVTVNVDNSITIEASTGSSEVWFKLASNKQFNNEKLFLSGCPGGGATNTYGIELDINNIRDTGSGISFQLTSDDVYIYVKANQSWTKTFYPMICTPEEYAISSNYQPFGVGNQVLTAASQELVNNGAKNKLDCSADTIKSLYVNNVDGSWSDNVYTVNNVGSITINEDGTITVVKTSSTTRLLLWLAYDVNPSQLVGLWLSGCPKGGSNTTYAINCEMTSYPYSSKGADYGNGCYIATSTSNLGIYINLLASFTTTGLTFKPMLCTKAEYDISDEFEPYALGNLVLTSGLIEQVDNGAKNIWDFANSTPGLSSNITSDKTNTSITVSSTTSGWSYISYSLPLTVGTYILHFKITNIVQPTGSAPMIRVSGSKNGDYSKGQIDIRRNGTYSMKFTVTQDGTYYVVFGANWQSPVYVSGYTASDLMVCTPADYGVSHKYVPYRPNWDLISTNAYGYRTTSNSGSVAGVINDAKIACGLDDTKYHAGIISVSTATDNEYLLVYFLYKYNTIGRGISITNNTITLSAINNLGTLAFTGGTAPYNIGIQFFY